MMFMPMFSPVRQVDDGITMIVTDLGGAIGFSNGLIGASGGSISGEPLDGETFAFAVFVPGPNISEIGFAGDIASLLSTLTLYVDGESYSLAGLAYYDGFDNSTRVDWGSNTGPIFQDGHSYTIRIA